MGSGQVNTTASATKPKKGTCGKCPHFKGCRGKWFDDPECSARKNERQLLQALEAAEWGGPESVLLSEEDAAGSRCCPVCCVWDYDGRHHPDCILAAAIKKARGG